MREDICNLCLTKNFGTKNKDLTNQHIKTNYDVTKGGMVQWANKYMERLSSPLITKELISTVWYNYTAIRMAKIKKKLKISILENVDQREPSHTVGGSVSEHNALENNLTLSTKSEQMCIHWFSDFIPRYSRVNTWAPKEMPRKSL